MEIRNDINHAGFRDNPKTAYELKKVLQDSFNIIKEINW